MKFYHRTTEERWKLIQKEGILWGKHGQDNKGSYRYTYLAPKDPGESYGPVLLEVEYTPTPEGFGTLHNYGFDPPKGMVCWQFSVFKPIELKDLNRIEVVQKETPQIFRTESPRPK